jgi:hypothetical protein
VSRYLITKKNLDPLRVVPVSYGQSAPVEDNKTPQARAKNRRVEILVYRDGRDLDRRDAGSPAAAACAQRIAAERDDRRQPESLTALR